MKKILKWFDNYWYHYKTITLMAVFIIAIVLVMAVQCTTKTDDDVTVMYAGPAILTEGQTREINSAFRSLLDTDYNKDGEKQVTLQDLLIMTDEQYAKALENADANGTVLYINQSQLADNRTRFSTLVFAGEAVICILDPALYTTVYNAGGVASFKDTLGYVPENAKDDNCIYLKDTAFAQYFSAFDVFPEDSILFCRATSTMSGMKSTKGELNNYQCQVDYFKKLMSFEISE